MAESRQLSVRLSEATFAKLEAIKPEGISLAEVARKVIEKQLGTGAELPLLALRERGPQPVDMTPMLAALEGFEQRVWEAQREMLRSVRAADDWMRRRLMPQNEAEVADIKKDLRSELDRKAANAGEQAVREWERSVGR
jgi:hypothetical protein